MVYFKEIRKTAHYVEFHEKDVPWSKVIELILTGKNKRKKGDKLEIEEDGYHILCDVRDQVLFVINAKHDR